MAGFLNGPGPAVTAIMAANPGERNTVRRQIAVHSETFPLEQRFVISRGARTQARVIVCTITEDGHRGCGEAVPYPHYGEDEAGVQAAIEAMAEAIGGGMDREGLAEAMPAGAARNAIDCALWDIEAKISGNRAHRVACRLPPRPVTTAMTISLDDPATMAAAARAARDHSVIKVKVGTGDDVTRIHAVASSAPGARIILDANEGWTEDNLAMHLRVATEMRVALIEQPLPAGKDEMLRHIPHPVPICADESAHVAADLDDLVGRYDFVNIKLDKAGGLTEALKMRERARELGFGVMVGCMVGSSLAMAPAVLLAQEADFVDLDGPLLLARDRKHGLTYAGSVVSPPDSSLWG